MRDVHLTNARRPIVRIASGSVLALDTLSCSATISRIDRQPPNASFLIVWRVGGRRSMCKDMHRANELLPIVSSIDERWSSFMEVHPENVSFSMAVTNIGMITDVKLLQSLNASSDMFRNPGRN